MKPLTVCLSLSVLGVASCARPAPELPRPKNVVVILSDTLRADHMGLFGYDRPTTPWLDGLAADSVVFERATAAAPATFPSVNTLFTSRSPESFFETSAQDLGIPSGLTTMAEVFRARGFATAAVSASPVVRASGSFFNPAGGFGQGFDIFDESCSHSERHVESFSADCVTEAALGIVDRSLPQEGFLLYVHYLDPHDPYQPPPEFDVFTSDYVGPWYVREGRTYPLTEALEGRGDAKRPTGSDVQHLIDLYDGEILAMDHALSELFEAFETRGLLEDTLFVLLSDHGESFLEHDGVLQHGRSLFQEEIHVPLIFHWSGSLSGRRRADLACSVDVLPTILALAGMESPVGAVGSPLIDREGRDARGSRLCWSAGRPDWRAKKPSLMSVRDGTAKVMVELGEPPEIRVFDLGADPGERDDLSARLDETPRHLLALRDLLLRKVAEATGEGAPVALDPEAERALRSLGYIE